MDKKTIFVLGIVLLIGLMLTGCAGYYGGYGYYDYPFFGYDDYPYYNYGYGYYGYPYYHGMSGENTIKSLANITSIVSLANIASTKIKGICLYRENPEKNLRLLMLMNTNRTVDKKEWSF